MLCGERPPGSVCRRASAGAPRSERGRPHPDMAPQVPQQGADPALAPASAPATPVHRRGRSTRTNPEEAKTLLAARRIRSGETLSELAEDLLRLTKMAYPRMDSASQDELARDRLLVEVEDPVARKRARQAHPPSLATALRELTGCDPAAASSSVPASVTTTGRVRDSSEEAHEDDLAAAVRENTDAVRQLVEMLNRKRQQDEEHGYWGLGWARRLFW